ncbi:MAG: pyridoxal-phosphate dependent enzyme [Planctomycetota bacterium]|nr:pyridoxal-phosphate dependent enzyme [Planctomycetota bacterium]
MTSHKTEPRGALFDLMPSLAKTTPFVQLGAFPTRVQELSNLAEKPAGGALWMKRDDETCPGLLGGCKVRKMEFLLGDALARGANLVTVLSASGSNFLRSVAAHAARLGMKTCAMLYDQYESPMAKQNLAESERVGVLHGRIFSRLALPAALLLQRAGKVWGVNRSHMPPDPRVYPMPPGGSSPLGCLGYVSAALELAGQVSAGLLPRPDYVVFPVGSGGIMAGLLVGFKLAGMKTQLIGVRVVDAVIANKWHVARLANSTARLLQRLVCTAYTNPPVAADAGTRSGDETRMRSLYRTRTADVTILADYFGGEYARPTPKSARAAAVFESATGIALETTYSAKAFAAALDLAGAARKGENILFWCTSLGATGTR